ncbi:MAG: DEAD/DEAH box helicase [Oscillospiraceae bacterium]|nr:DEAD/DEAH box helicase [Oscillospiraceae bacterium]
MNQGFAAAFVGGTNITDLAFKPEFVFNNHKNGQKVLSFIERELQLCDSFDISVAFITKGGITPLLQVLRELNERGVPGRILTTDYLMFSEPEALQTISKLNNIQLRMYQVDNGPGFHTKGYIFRNNGIFRILIGSSNLTQSAITVNKEWNTKIVSTEQGEFAQKVREEFDSLWESNHSRAFSEFIQDYELRYEIAQKQREVAKQDIAISLPSYTLTPNSMQVGFIRSLVGLRKTGADRGLLISATGTGKTYASAFGVRDALQPQGKVLFIVHRKQILRQAMASYQNVFGRDIKMALLTGEDQNYDEIKSADFLFAMITMISKEGVLDRFSETEFKTIVIDEAHHAPAPMYQRVLNHFKPSFWLGMTATPDRTDAGNTYEIFDHNIAYEIRLQQALENDLLCPFHYFGIKDLEIDGKTVDDETNIRNFRYLVCEDRVNYIIKQANYFGHSGKRVKGLIFCSRREEARELSEKFNEKGLRTVFLSGEDSDDFREEMMDRLTSDNRGDVLDYILTVGIFNEGVDLPEVNQVIMLRPTQSPIVFVQQLGRGLRKANLKEYVVILDFIGNYKNNFMIPIALSGDRTYNKDNVRRYLMEGNRVIPGCSTIHFDEVSRKRIFEAIDTANFSDLQLIKENYKNLKDKLGRIPGLMDFDRYGEMDVLRIFDNKNLGSYYKFLARCEKDYKIRLNPKEEKFIEFFSKKLANGKRIHEIEMLKCLLEGQTGTDLMQQWEVAMKDKWHLDAKGMAAGNVINVLTNEFPSGGSKRTYEECVFIQKDGTKHSISDAFAKMLQNPDFYNMVWELLEFAQHRYERDYRNGYQGTDFVLYQKYTYEDVCRLLGWKHSVVAQNIGGYKLDQETKTFPVFINYDKDVNIQDTIRYEDHFESPDRLVAISKSKRTIKSKDVQNFLHANERGISVELYVRKNKDDKISKEFYYLGHMTATGKAEEFIMPNTTAKAVKIEWLLDTPVRTDLYDYIVG